VLVTGRTASELAEVAAATGGEMIVADLADSDGVSQIVAAAGAIDVLINNAGIADSAPLHRTTDDLWERMMSINATQPFRLCRALVPAMVERGFGRVVNVASTAGITGYAYTAAYCASKHALVGLTRALALDVATRGVTVNAVCPGWVETRLLEETTARIAHKTGRSVDDAARTLADMSPQRRLMTAEEVANAVAFLCAESADGAQGINGQTLVIDGGGVMK
jgi:3-hydroxybutyrate dehydrogenase